MSETQLMEQFYQKIAIKEIKNRIKKFNLEKDSLTEKEVSISLKNLLLFTIPNTGGVQATILASLSHIYQEGAQFFRARKLENDFNENAFELEDFWEPPPEVVGLGRFNRPLESYLYLTSGEYFTPKKEIGIKNKGERYLLMYYKLNEALPLFSFGESSILGDLTRKSRQKIKVINNFINDLMLSSEDGAYIISSALSNEFLKFKELDGWCYPSVKDINAVNACVRVSEKEKFDLKNTFLCEVDKNGNDIFIGVFFIVENDVSYCSFDDNPTKVKDAVDKLYSDNLKISKKDFVLSEQDASSPVALVKILE